jgi:hypothetical protein
MPRPTENAYAATVAKVTAALAPMPVFRDPVDRVEMGPSFAAIFTGEEPERIDETLSVRHYSFRADVGVEFYLQDPDPADVLAFVDQKATAIAAAIEADRTLGGVVDFTDLSGVTTASEGIEGAAGLTYGGVTISLFYQSSSPVG